MGVPARSSRRAALTRSLSDSAGTWRAPRSAAPVSPEPAKRAGEMTAEDTSAAARRSK